MNLYDRQQQVGGYSQEIESQGGLISFVKTTYKFFAGSLLFATCGALWGLSNFEMVMQYKWVFFIIELVALLGLMFLKTTPTLNIFMLFVFTAFSGVTLVPLLGFVIATSGLSAIWQALGMTTIIFGIMSIYAIKTPRDLADMGKMLFISLIVVVVCSLLNAFLLKSSMFQILISGACTILFSLFVAYDTKNILKGLYSSPIEAAVALYLDFLNIFISILQLLGIFNSKND
ncbi:MULTISPECIES: Bax inhibitor-1/YccA family protein [unclassified Helicobacter]|uniref:Bax inhibitor-1/YccA family protein n=1 Tax=unclassified Helicobacter TaxID=2593540 RepID=UPI000CF11605|nr:MULTISPECIES: Bax inhibitor-1/YccA family protein [unclassified Helicobacter]